VVDVSGISGLEVRVSRAAGVPDSSRRNERFAIDVREVQVGDDAGPVKRLTLAGKKGERNEEN
jgi:hypothetical protein